MKKNRVQLFFVLSVIMTFATNLFAQDTYSASQELFNQKQIAFYTDLTTKIDTAFTGGVYRGYEFGIWIIGRKVLFSARHNYESNGNDRSQKMDVKIFGEGPLIYDTQNNQLVATIKTKAKGEYKETYSWSERVRHVDEEIAEKNRKKSVWGNVLFGNDDAFSKQNAVTYTTEYHTDRWYASLNDKEDSFILKFSTDGDKITYLNDIELNIELKGDKNIQKNFILNKGLEGPEPWKLKMKETRSQSFVDEFGEWKWNQDRSRIYLESSNNDGTFVIGNVDGRLTWAFELPSNSKGMKEETTENGDVLSYMTCAFDGAQAIPFTFVKQVPNSAGNVKTSALENEASDQDDDGEEYPDDEEDNNDVVVQATETNDNLTKYSYATYNRFLGKMNYNSANVLQDMADKQLLVLSYRTLEGEPQTVFFNLQGLESIIEYINE